MTTEFSNQQKLSTLTRTILKSLLMFLDWSQERRSRGRSANRFLRKAVTRSPASSSIWHRLISTVLSIVLIQEQLHQTFLEMQRHGLSMILTDLWKVGRLI